MFAPNNMYRVRRKIVVCSQSLYLIYKILHICERLIYSITKYVTMLRNDYLAILHNYIIVLIVTNFLNLIFIESSIFIRIFLYLCIFWKKIAIKLNIYEIWMHYYIFIVVVTMFSVCFQYKENFFKIFWKF